VSDARRPAIWLIGAVVALFGAAVIAYFQVLAAPERIVREATIAADGCLLHARLSFRDDADEWVALVHGNRPAGQSHPLYKRLKTLIPRAYNVLALDLGGYGRSHCSHSEDLPFPDRSGDIVAAVEFLSAEHEVEPESVTVIGHSLGAVLALKSAAVQPGVRVIALAPGDFTRILSEDDAVRRYVDNARLPTTAETVRQFRAQTAPERILEEQVVRRATVVVGGKDSIPLLVRGDGSGPPVVVVPWADHMYGTERRRFRRPASAFQLALLRWRLRGVLAETAVEDPIY
jgi:pimeloyl-ACP methyl ester carboxylesterase